MGRPRNRFLEEETKFKRPSVLSRVVVIPRSQWGAVEPKTEIPGLTLPVTKVLFSWTDSEKCLISFECEPFLKKQQRADMDNGMADIRPNFLVGMDKVVYEGRGWSGQPHSFPDTIVNADKLNGQCIEIAFIDKNMEQPENDMVDTALRFLALMVIENKVSRTVKMYGLKDNKFVKFSKLFDDGLKIIPDQSDEDY